MATLLHSGIVRTMRSEHDVAEALVIDGERIAFVGDEAGAREVWERLRDLPRDRSDEHGAPEGSGAPDGLTAHEEIDLAGAALLPAFIDAHGHFLQVGLYAELVDLSCARDIDGIIDLFEQEARDRGPDDPRPLIGVNYDHADLAEQRHPTRDDLDRVGTEAPVFALHRSVHLGAASGAALTACGIDEDTPDPAGGRFGRRVDGRTPDGYVEEMSALALIAAGLGALGARPGTRGSLLVPGAQVDAARTPALAQEQYLAQGITTLQEGAATAEDVADLLAAGRRGDLIVDVVAYPLVNSGGLEVLRARGAELSAGSDHVRIGGAKLILDGSPQGRSAWLSEPYEAVPGDEHPDAGYAAMDDEDVTAAVTEIMAAGAQVLAHCNGDAASAQFIRAVATARGRLGEAARTAPAPVMIHAQSVRDDQLEEMARLGIAASFFVGHIHRWGDVHRRNLGAERAARISPVRAALARGVLTTLHQDAPVTDPDMRESLACAVGRTTRTGVPLGAGEKGGPDLRVSPYQALAAVTREAARQYGREHEVGMLAPGMRADLVVLDADPVAVGAGPDGPQALRSLRILRTVKDGRTVHLADTAPNDASPDQNPSQENR